jgi:type IV secretory pathway VirJ component
MRRSAMLLAVCAAMLAASPASADATGGLAGLPLKEMAAAGPGDTLVVLYSGDGGWAGIDAGLASGFVKAGLPVVGVDSLRYFLTQRTPAGAAADLAALVDHYTSAWRRPRVILAGYSFGADALPAIAAQLPPQLRSRVRLLALVGVAARGELKFQPGAWLNISGSDAYPIAPVLAGLGPMPRVCVFGDRDPHDACARFGPGAIRPIKVAGSHHFGGDYAPVSAAILKAAGL